MNKVTLQFFPDFSFIISSAKVSLVKGVPVIHQYIAEKIEDLPAPFLADSSTLTPSMVYKPSLISKSTSFSILLKFSI